jgi:hypothetical protein
MIKIQQALVDNPKRLDQVDIGWLRQSDVPADICDHLKMLVTKDVTELAVVMSFLYVVVSQSPSGGFQREISRLIRGAYEKQSAPQRRSVAESTTAIRTILDSHPDCAKVLKNRPQIID